MSVSTQLIKEKYNTTNFDIIETEELAYYIESLLEDGEITIDDLAIGFISIDEDSYTIEYEVTDVTIEKLVNNNKLLLKYIDLVRSLLVTTVE